MGNSNSIAPVGAIPAAMPVIQRKPRQQQADNEHDTPAQSNQEPEEKHQTTDDNKKAGGLDCYA
jgi:hypothetical protein